MESLPKFGGKGMYGTNVHKAVLAAGETVSGATVHFVNEDYDDGAVISVNNIGGISVFPMICMN